jgi:hypothetical protein
MFLNNGIVNAFMNISNHSTITIKLTIASIFAGGVAKLYDDVTDSGLFPFLNTEYYLEIIKGMHYVLLTSIMLLNDPIFYVIALVGNALNYIADSEQFKKSYEKSLLFVFPILSAFIDFSKININKTDLAFMTSFICGMGIEPLIFKEDISIKKCLFRIISILIIVMLLLLNPNINFGIKCVFMYSIGYLIVSVINQINHLYIEPSKLTNLTNHNDEIVTTPNISNEDILTHTTEKELVKTYENATVK